ncbi:hypothetical protein D3C76_1398780 [compost metagenome]
MPKPMEDIDNIRSILSDIQRKMNSLMLEEEVPEDIDNVLTSFRDTLSDIDLSTATDDEITTMFDKWAQIVAESRQPIS